MFINVQKNINIERTSIKKLGKVKDPGLHVYLPLTTVAIH